MRKYSTFNETAQFLQKATSFKRSLFQNLSICSQCRKTWHPSENSGKFSVVVEFFWPVNLVIARFHIWGDKENVNERFHCFYDTLEKKWEVGWGGGISENCLFLLAFFRRSSSWKWFVSEIRLLRLTANLWKAKCTAVSSGSNPVRESFSAVISEGVIYTFPAITLFLFLFTCAFATLLLIKSFLAKSVFFCVWKKSCRADKKAWKNRQRNLMSKNSTIYLLE